MLIEEDPVEAKKLGILPGNVEVTAKVQVGQIEDDTDQGLEAQVNAIVEKFTKEHEERIAARINELESDLSTTIRVEKDHMKRKFEMDVSKLEK